MCSHELMSPLTAYICCCNEYGLTQSDPAPATYVGCVTYYLLSSGLGIQSSVFWSNRYFCDQKIERSNRSWKRSKSEDQRDQFTLLVEKGENLRQICFLSESLVFCSNLLQSRANRSRRCFLKIDGIDSLKVDLFKRSTRAIRSWSIFLKDQRERFDHGQSFLKIKKSERSQDRIPTPWLSK